MITEITSSITGSNPHSYSHSAKREPETDPYWQAYRLDCYRTREHPNGEVTVGLIPNQKKKKPQSEKAFDRDRYNHLYYLSVRETAEETANELGLSKAERMKAFAKLEGVRHEDVIIQRREAPKQKRTPKGKRGLTSYGGRSVRNDAHILQKNYGRKRLGFATFTLPNDDEYLTLWIDESSEVVRQLKQKIQRELAKHDAPIHLTGCTEIQLKRSLRDGYMIPHWHFVYVAWDGINRDKNGRKKWYISHSRMQEMFKEVLVNIIDAKYRDRCFVGSISARVSVESVRKNAEGYLGKYMSKGKKDIDEFMEKTGTPDCPIKHWWHSTKELRNIRKGLIKELPKDILTAILQKVNLKARGVCYYIKEITKQIGDAERVIGWVLKLKPAYAGISKNEIIEAFNTA